MGGLFDSPDPPPPPKPLPPAPMPDDQSPLVKEAGRKRAAAWSRRGGRASTILSQGEDDNGPYSHKTLG